MMTLRTLALLSLLFVSSSLAEDDVEPEARLLMACMGNFRNSDDDVDEVKSALAAGANINIHDKRSGQTALMAATLRGKVDIVTHLLAEGADVTIAEKDGYTPAHGAGFSGYSNVMAALKDHGVDVLADQHQDGFYPFHRACWGSKAQHAETVAYLLEQGVDPNLEAADGKRCIEMTRNRRTIKVLEEAGAEPSRFTDEDEL